MKGWGNQDSGEEVNPEKWAEIWGDFSPRDIRGTVKRYNIHVTGVQEGKKESQNEGKAVSKKVMYRILHNDKIAKGWSKKQFENFSITLSFWSWKW